METDTTPDGRVISNDEWPLQSTSCANNVEGEDTSMHTLVTRGDDHEPQPGGHNRSKTDLSRETRMGSVKADDNGIETSTSDAADERSRVEALSRRTALLTLSRPVATNWETLESDLRTEISHTKKAAKGRYEATAHHNSMSIIVTTLQQEVDDREMRLVRLSGKDKGLFPDYQASSWDTRPMQKAINDLVDAQGLLTRMLKKSSLSRGKSIPGWQSDETLVEQIWTEFEGCKSKCEKMDTLLKGVNSYVQGHSPVEEKLEVGIRHLRSLRARRPDHLEEGKKAEEIAKWEMGDMGTLLSLDTDDDHK